MTISLSNYRDWLPFVFIIIGVVLAMIAPFLRTGNEVRKKTNQLLSTFRDSLHVQDIDHWREIYHGTREAAAAPAGHFISRLGKPVALDSMWADDSEEHTAVQRMAEGLEAVSAEMLDHSVDVKKIWFEIGQLMEAMHGWLENIPGVLPDSTFLDEQYPFLKQVFIKHGNRFKKWPCRVYLKR
jgi:hypothetical protein